MTPPQRAAVEALLRHFNPARVLHGDCIGADADFDSIAEQLGIYRGCLPCNLKNQRALTRAVVLAPEIAPLVRNKIIVDEADFMIGTPGEMQEELRSGTWAAIRHARRTHKRRFIVWPDGTVERENDAIPY